MTENTQQVKELLLEEKSRLETELGTVGRKIKNNDWEATADDGDRDRGDESEVADEIGDLEKNRAIVSGLEAQLNDVTQAIQKIDENRYGTCETCGKTIEEDRLRANPSARTCKSHM